jgi:hypothetical protein
VRQVVETLAGVDLRSRWASFAEQAHKLHLNP